MSIHLKVLLKHTLKVLDNCSVFGRVVKLMFETQLFVADGVAKNKQK